MVIWWVLPFPRWALLVKGSRLEGETHRLVGLFIHTRNRPIQGTDHGFRAILLGRTRTEGCP